MRDFREQFAGNVFPAYAGMIPNVGTARTLTSGVPRIRVDDPVP